MMKKHLEVLKYFKNKLNKHFQFFLHSHFIAAKIRESQSKVYMKNGKQYSFNSLIIDIGNFEMI